MTEPRPTASAKAINDDHRSASEWARARADLLVELAIVLAITAIAAALRLWALDTTPLGLHGDEAWTGLDAQRLLREGWIGPYVLSALGQPTGPLYVTAAFLKFLPDDTETIRLSMASLGVLTIPIAYLAVRSMYDRVVATISIGILTGLMWHLHLSRTGFMVTSWPLMQMLVLWALWWALRERRWWQFVIAGGVAGLGVYSYNAYLLFLPVPLVALAWTLAREPREQRVAFLRQAGAFAITALIVALPLLNYIVTHRAEYDLHQEIVGVTHQQEWYDAGWVGRVEILTDRTGEFVRGLVWGDRDDFGDGLASPGHPVVHPMIAALALAGIVMVVRRFREPANAVLLSAMLILPLGAILTVSDGLFRRTLGLAPIVAVLAALPLAWVWRRAGVVQSRGLRVAGVAAVAASVIAPGVVTAYQYFGPVQDSFVMRYVYPYELDAASRYMDTLPAGTTVYFYSDRWMFDYETRVFLAPDVTGVNRSKEFRRGRLRPDEVDLTIAPGRSQAFVFMEPYMDRLDDVVALYSGGEVHEERRGELLLFRAYYLPLE